MAEIRHLEIRHDVIFLCWRWSDLDKISQPGVESTAVIWSRSKPDVEFQYGGCLGEFHGMSSQSHVTHCKVLHATWWSHCYDSKATCHIAGCSHLAKSMSWSCYIAGCNNSIRHIENRFSPYFFCFLMQCGLWRAAAFVSSPMQLFISRLPKRNL